MAISQEWWDKWWEEDFSWEGLAKKRWEGWVVMDDGRVLPMEDAPGELRKDIRRDLTLPDGFPGRQATLQDYWRDQKDDLIPIPGESVQFTPVHLPPVRRDGTPVDPSLRPGEDQLNAIIKAKLEAAEETSFSEIGAVEGADKRAQFQGVVFPHFNLAYLTDRANDLPSTQDQPARIPLSARFEFAAFSGNASFVNAAFSGYAWFENAAFSGNARFVNAAFSGNARFENAAFSGYAWFENAAFSGNARFVNAAFSGNARFENAAFSGYAWFENAAFSGNARFENAAFSGYAWFENAAFSGNAWFENAAFSGNARFVNAAFSGNARFENAAFSGNASFENAAFSGNARFVNAAFSGYAWFENAAFSGNASFENAAFSGNASFENAAFSGYAWFVNAAFSGNARFVNAVFLSVVSFAGQGAELVKPEESHSLEFSQEEVVFKGTLKLPQQITPQARRAFKNGSFENAILLGDAVITNRDMLDRLSFDNVVFGGAAEFQGSNLHQGVSFFGANFTFVLNSPEGKSFAVHFKDEIAHARAAYAAYVFLLRLAHSIQKTDAELVSFQDYIRGWVRGTLENAPKPGKDTSKHSSRHALIERAFRKLKLSMEEVRNKIQEQDFYRMELLARRRRRDKSVPWWERQISRLYEAVSGFGGSIVRPIRWILVLICLSGLCAYSYELISDARWPYFSFGAAWDEDFLNATGFSIANTFPFGAFGDIRKEFLSGLEDAKGWQFVFRLAATFQSFATLVLVFLSGLAIRRRFQIS